MSHVSGQEFCVMPRCERNPDDRIVHPLCSRHALGVYRELKDLVSDVRPVVSHAPAISMRGRTDEQGWVYFMRMGELIKIGFSTNVDGRAKQLGGTVLAKVPGTRRDEKAMHAKFGHLWVRREFFDPGEDLLRHIEGLSA